MMDRSTTDIFSSGCQIGLLQKKRGEEERRASTLTASLYDHYRCFDHTSFVQ
jgi:hypothetical protein